MSLTTAQIAQQLNGQLIGDGAVCITGLAPADHARPGELTFAENASYFALAENSQAAAILVSEPFVSAAKVLIRVPNARIALARALPIFFPPEEHPRGIHPSAVISSSAAFARGVLTRPDQPHLCYVHSPVRYAWDEQFSYLQQGRLGFGPKGMLYRYMLHRLRTWDTRTAHGPDLMLANSNYVRSRIQHIYGREARVVFPPVALAELPCVEDKDDYYVSASFLAPYKRTDLVIRAFNEMPSRRLVIVGEGQQSAGLRALAGPNVTFSGYLPRQDYVDTLARAKAMVFAGCEDFGIALAEAQACGTPLIAFGRGGAVDIVQRLGSSPEPTGVLFKAQTVDHLKEAVERFEQNSHAITPRACARNAGRFSEENFDRAILESLGAVQALHELI